MTFSPETGHEGGPPESPPRPRFGSRRLAGAVAALVVVLIVSGIWWWSQRGRFSLPPALSRDGEAAATDGQQTTDEQADLATGPPDNGHSRPRAAPSQATAANGNAARGEQTVKPSATGGGEPRIDLSQTSWENPFTDDHWESKGWTFDDVSMQSNVDDFASASFRRKYRKLTIDCRVEALGDPGTFQIVLFAPETDALLKAEFTPKLVRVISDIRNRRKVIKRRDMKVPFTAAEPVHLRLTATGNRVLIFSNNRVVFSLNQPAEQSGKHCRLSLRCTGGRFRVSRLHLEGE